jgi:hypothetical protein
MVNPKAARAPVNVAAKVVTKAASSAHLDADSDTKDYQPSEEDSDSDSGTDDDCSHASSGDEDAGDAVAAPIVLGACCDLIPGNILPRGERRKRIATKRYVDDLLSDPEYRSLMLEDIPPEELQAALVDSDYSCSDVSGSESGSDDSFVE